MSLCMEVRLDEDRVDLRRVVNLLGKAVHFPELQAYRVTLDGLIEEAKCQVINDCKVGHAVRVHDIPRTLRFGNLHLPACLGQVEFK